MLTRSIIEDINARYPNTFGEGNLVTWLNQAIREARQETTKLELLHSTLTAHSRIYKLPDGIRFGDITALVVENVEYDFLHGEEDVRPNIYFKIDERIFAVNPIPTGAQPVHITYRKALDPVEDIDSEVEIPDEFAEILKLGVFVIMANAEGDVALANNYSKSYNALASGARAQQWRDAPKYPQIKAVQ